MTVMNDKELEYTFQDYVCLRRDHTEEDSMVRVMTLQIKILVVERNGNHKELFRNYLNETFDNTLLLLHDDPHLQLFLDLDYRNVVDIRIMNDVSLGGLSNMIREDLQLAVDLGAAQINRVLVVDTLYNS